MSRSLFGLEEEGFVAEPTRPARCRAEGGFRLSGSSAGLFEFERAVAAIDAGRTASVYVLHGPERHAQRAVLDALRRRMRVGELGEETFSGTRAGAAEVVAALRAVGLGGGRLIVVEELPAEPSDALLAYLEHPAPDAVLVVRCEALDRRRKLSRRLIEAGEVVECRPPRPPEATAWLRRRGLSPKAAELMVSRLPPSLDLYERELEKAAAYGGADAGALEALLPPARDERVFDLLDAIAERRGSRAFDLVNVLRSQGEEPLGLLALLAHQIRLILRASELRRRGLRADQIAGQVGAHPYAVRRALDQARRFGAGELEAGLEALWLAEWSVKSGERTDGAALEMALVDLARPARDAR